MKKLLLFGLLIFCGCSSNQPQKQFLPPPPSPIQQAPQPVTPKLDGTYEGKWITTNRPLDGIMKCDVTDLGGRWKGKFYGVWMGRSFTYTVDWTGTPQSLQGSAVIDGASYQWTGTITEQTFKGTFGGNRYRGSFDLKK